MGKEANIVNHTHSDRGTWPACDVSLGSACTRTLRGRKTSAIGGKRKARETTPPSLRTLVDEEDLVYDNIARVDVKLGQFLHESLSFVQTQELKHERTGRQSCGYGPSVLYMHGFSPTSGMHTQTNVVSSGLWMRDCTASTMPAPQREEDVTAVTPQWLIAADAEQHGNAPLISSSLPKIVASEGIPPAPPPIMAWTVENMGPNRSRRPMTLEMRLSTACGRKGKSRGSSREELP